MTGPTERWYANHEGRDHVSVEVRFPNEVLVYTEPGLDSARWVWLRIGGVRFLLPVDQMRLLLEAAMEQLDDLTVAAGGTVPTDPPAVVSFNDANVGDEVFTWQVADGHDWGDYVFETVDPAETGADDMESDIIRKRWRLVEIELIPSPWPAVPTDPQETP